MGSRDRTSRDFSGSSTTFFVPCLATIRSFTSSISDIQILEEFPKTEIILRSIFSVDQQRPIPQIWLGRILSRCKISNSRWYAAAKRQNDVHALFWRCRSCVKKVTRRSKTGILILCDQAPLMWLNKKQNSVETSTFGSEFTALKLTVELVIALR